jgi:hypothetical protein
MPTTPGGFSENDFKYLVSLIRKHNNEVSFYNRALSAFQQIKPKSPEHYHQLMNNYAWFADLYKEIIKEEEELRRSISQLPREYRKILKQKGVKLIPVSKPTKPAMPPRVPGLKPPQIREADIKPEPFLHRSVYRKRPVKPTGVRALMSNWKALAAGGAAGAGLMALAHYLTNKFLKRPPQKEPVPKDIIEDRKIFDIPKGIGPEDMKLENIKPEDIEPIVPQVGNMTGRTLPYIPPAVPYII